MEYPNKRNQYTNTPDSIPHDKEQPYFYSSNYETNESSSYRNDIYEDDSNEEKYYQKYDAFEQRALSTIYLKDRPSPKATQKSYPILGMFGSLIGAILGGAIWFFIAYYNYMPAFVGLFTVYFALFGYKLLGRKLTRFGICYSIVIAVITIYVAHHLSWSYDIFIAYTSKGYEYTFKTAIINCLGVAEHVDQLSSFFQELFIGYALTFLGSINYIVDVYKAASPHHED